MSQCDPEALFIGEALQSLLHLGAQSILLTHVVIDLATLCPTKCYRPGGSRNTSFLRLGLGKEYLNLSLLVPILRRTNWNFDLKFIQPRGLGHQSNRELHLDAPLPDLDTEALNKMVRSLIRDDLKIERWMRPISLIGIDRNGKDGCIIFRCTHDSCRTNKEKDRYHPCTGSSMRFSITDHDELCFDAPIIPSLLTIPVRLQERIFMEAMSEDGKIVINVDRDDPATILTPSRLLLNRELLKTAQDGLLVIKDRYWKMPFKFVLNANKGTLTDFDFQPLRRWLSTGAPSRLPYRGRFTRHMWRTTRLKISIECDLSTEPHTHGLQDLRIDVIPLILITSHLTATRPVDDHDVVLVEFIAHWLNPHGKAIAKRHVVSLRELRSTVLRALIREMTLSRSFSVEPQPGVIISGYGLVHRTRLDNLEHGRARRGGLPHGYEGMHWNPSWTQQDGPFDGSKERVANYLWRVFTGGQANACAKKCESNTAVDASI
jgi:hypothetical protein